MTAEEELRIVLHERKGINNRSFPVITASKIGDRIVALHFNAADQKGYLTCEWTDTQHRWLEWDHSLEAGMSSYIAECAKLRERHEQDQKIRTLCYWRESGEGSG